MAEAVDVCYKSFFALNIEFSKECTHIYTFLLYAVYKNSSHPTLTHYRRVFDFVNSIEKLLGKDANVTDGSLAENIDIDVSTLDIDFSLLESNLNMEVA